MLTGEHVLLPLPNQLNQDDDFFLRRLISKESSMAGPSYYGGVSAGVPFLWESKPGTPKHPSSSQSSLLVLPPLNPPPCYNRSALYPMKTRSKSFVFRNLFPKMTINRKKSHVGRRSPEVLSPSSSSSASSALSSPLSPFRIFRRSQSTAVRQKSMFDYELYDDKTSSAGSPTHSTRCFWN